MNSPSASADGFSGKLCGNTLTWRLKAGSRPEICSGQNDSGSSNVTIKHAATGAIVDALFQRLSLDAPTIGTRLARATWVDQFEHATGAFCLVADLLDEAVPSGILDGLGEHPGCQSFDVKVLHCDVRETNGNRSRKLVQAVTPLAGSASAMPSQTSFSLLAAPAAFLAQGFRVEVVEHLTKGIMREMPQVLVDDFAGAVSTQTISLV